MDNSLLSTLRLKIGCDDAGRNMAEDLSGYLSALGMSPQPIEHHHDYPLAAEKILHHLKRCEIDRGILICGSGIGMSIAANRWPHARAALVFSEELAQLSRSHNDSNILCLAGRFLSMDLARRITYTWLTTPFSCEERHFRRLDQIKSLSSFIQKRLQTHD